MLDLGHYRTMAQLKRESNGYFFDRDTRKTWGSVVYRNVYTGADGWYFVTSEQRLYENRTYKVRRFNLDGSVTTITEYPYYTTLEQALEQAKLEAKKGEK